MIDTNNRLPSEDRDRFEEMLDRLTAEAPLHRTSNIRFAFAVLETSLGLIDIFKYQPLDTKSWGYQIGQHLFERGTAVVKARLACPDSGYKYDFPFREPVILSDVQVVFPLEEILDALSSGGRFVHGIEFQVIDVPPER